MNDQQLPDGVTPRGSSPIFTKENLPDALCSEHALKANRWGVLQILEGTVTYVNLAAGTERVVSAPDLVTIEPERPHKLRLHDGALRCRIDFFEQVEDEGQRSQEC